MTTWWTRLGTLAVLCLLAVGVDAQARRPKPPKLVERPLLLWRVEKAGAVSHMLGTCHVEIPLEHALPMPHTALLDGARVLLTEADLGALTPMEGIRLMWAEPGQRLPDLLGMDDFRALAIDMRASVPAPMLARLRPWGVYLTRSLEPAAKPAATSTKPDADGGAEAPVLDLAVAKRFHGGDDARRYLETIDLQASILGAGDETFLAALRPGAAEDASWTRSGDATARLCSTGDVSGVDAFLRDPANATWTKVWLSDRNHAWMGPLGDELATGGAFVAVGAAHMLGPDGLVELLQAQGYAVTRLSGRAPERVLTSLDAAARGAVAPAPPVDPARLDTAVASLAHVPELICVPGNPMMDCFVSDADVCRAEVREGLKLCVQQFADRLGESGTFDPATVVEVAGCAGTGAILDAFFADTVGDGPVCTALSEKLNQPIAK